MGVIRLIRVIGAMFFVQPYYPYNPYYPYYPYSIHHLKLEFKPPYPENRKWWRKLCAK